MAVYLIKRFVLFFVVLALTFLIIGFLFAAEPVSLEKVVVTPYRYEDTVAKTPQAITVITESQIKSSNAQTVPDLLQVQPGVLVRDFYGNGTKVMVDMGGFGEASLYNTLVLVDGRRVNEIDNSGVDWTQIPLNNIEKIEIARGSGSVLYGDNASGGVVNIITRQGRGEPQWKAETAAGSYAMNQQSLSLSGSGTKTSYYFSASRMDTNGYRQNSYYDGNDFNAKLTYTPVESLPLRLSCGYHKSIFGLPGELSDTDLENMSRRSSKYGDDHAKVIDSYISVGATKDLESSGSFDLDVSYRRRLMDTYFLEFFGGWGNPIYKADIKTVGVTPRYTLKNTWAGHENSFIAGFDFYRADYSDDNYDYTDTMQNFTDINKITTGFYAQDEFALARPLYLVAGYRFEKAKYEFDYNDIAGSDPLDTNTSPSENAYNAGLVYKYAGDSSAFARFSRSFRFPTAEEYSVIWPSHSINTGLQPQTAYNYECGIKHRFGERAGVDVTAFRMEVNDELYYDFSTYTNGNYDKTRHEGIEVSFDAKIKEALTLTGNYTYLKAVFRDGAYDGNDIPLVPRHKAGLGMKYCFSPQATLNVLTNYVGKRYYMNDQENALSRLNDYFSLDSNLSYAWRDWQLVCAVNNILNRKYSEFAACNPGTGKKVYYPSPTTNFNVRVTHTF